MVHLGVYGVRGSSPISGADYIRYGGNTASFTLRTPGNSLIFLDAGTGIRIAEKELQKEADKVYLLISHSHADHIQGLGMTKLPFLSEINGYEDQKLHIIGPRGIKKSLSKFYDGEHLWPVKFASISDGRNPRFPDIEYEGIIEYQDNFQTISLDKTTLVSMKYGNHPVKSGVLLFRFEIERENQDPLRIVYATDNEFDALNIEHPNPEAEKLKQEYKSFIQDSDLVIADAQYTQEDYHNHYMGFGHSYHEQIIDLAHESNVAQLLLTHHHLYPDEILDELEDHLQDYIRETDCNVLVKLAQEGRHYNL